MKRIERRAAPTLLIGLVCFLFLGGIALAMSSDNYAINWDVIGGGGEPANSTNYAMRSTIGQPAAETFFCINRREEVFLRNQIEGGEKM